MTDVTPLPPPVPPRIVVTDLPCVHCGYDLRTLDSAAACPECGTPVARSLEGNYLAYADPGWLKRLRTGAGLVAWGMLSAVGANFLLPILLFLILILSGQDHAAAVVIFLVVAAIVGVGVAGVWLYGVVALGAAEPRARTPEGPWSARRVMLGSAWAGVGAPFALAAGLRLEEPVITGLAAPLVLVMMLWPLAVCARLGTLFARVPHDRLVRQTRVVRWGLGLSLGAMLLGAGAMRALALAGPVRPVPVPGSLAPPAVDPLALIGTLAVTGLGGLGALGTAVFVVWLVVLLFVLRQELAKALVDADLLADGV